MTPAPRRRLAGAPPRWPSSSDSTSPTSAAWRWWSRSSPRTSSSMPVEVRSSCALSGTGRRPNPQPASGSSHSTVGQGSPDLDAALRDGYSSAGSSGTGLGAIRRASSEFDVYSDRAAGTALVAVLQPSPPPRTHGQPMLRVAGLSIAKQGEEAAEMHGPSARLRTAVPSFSSSTASATAREPSTPPARHAASSGRIPRSAPRG